MSKFCGKWICAEEIRPNLYTVYRKTFFTDKEGSFLMRISADDYYKLKINGQLVGMGPAPAYHFNYNYNEYNISPFIIDGENKIEVIVYYQGLVNRVWVSGDGKQGLIADIYKNNELFLSTDSSWNYTVDKTFVGSETVGYDTAFLEDRNMLLCDNCENAPVEKECVYTFAENPFPAVKFFNVKPVEKDNLIFDFGQEYVATLNLNLTSNADGEKVTILYGEELNDDGTVRYNLRCNCDYKEEIILKKGENLIEQFDYKAFRYVQLIPSKNVTLNHINITVRHFPFEQKFTLNTNDEKLQKVFELCRNTIKYGCQEVLVDCPTREKGQYIGDTLISGFAHLILTEDKRLLKKAIENIAESIEFSGDILSVSPCSYKQKIADYTLQIPLILWRYYKYTKDKDFLLKMVPLCDKVNKHFKKYADCDGLLNKVDGEWNLVDWPGGARDNYDFPLTDPIGQGKHNVINAFYVGNVIYTEKIKTELNIPFTEESTQLKNAFNNTFLKKGVYVDSEVSNHSALHSNCLPVFFEICPDEHKEKIGQLLTQKGMACSVYMSFFYLKALCKLGLKDEAYRLITSDGKNSWLNMLGEGATTTFEAWGKEQKWNTSLFHPWATSPIILLAEDLKHYHCSYTPVQEP